MCFCGQIGLKKLGYGDTFVILVLGITLGDQTLASILFIASLAALIYVKYTKQHALPFRPLSVFRVSFEFACCFKLG